MRALQVVTGMPEAFEGLGQRYTALMESYGVEKEEAAKALSRLDEWVVKAKALAAGADDEVKSDFSATHAQACITLWAYLEAHVRQFAVLWYLNMPETLESEQIRKLCGYRRILKDYLWTGIPSADTASPVT